MTPLLFTLIVILGGTSALVSLVRFARTWKQARGVRLITCPETRRPAAVRLDALDAGLAAAVSERSLHLRSCTRWPEKRNCNQACLSQIVAAADGCLARARVAQWYTGKSCVFCHKPIEALTRIDRRPGLLTPDGLTMEWDDAPIEMLPDVFETHQPVCWSCHVSETFRRQFIEVVVDRERQERRERVIH
jgi:hypothetical protein